MERKAGFKECPKCGLRNKPTAVQCDFCGQSLTAGDDWQSHVKDLESFTKADSRGTVDYQTSRRIESTIIRKEPPHHKPVEVKEVANLEDILKEFDKTPPVKDEPAVEPPKEASISAEAPSGTIVTVEPPLAVSEEAPKIHEEPTEPKVITEPVPGSSIEKRSPAETATEKSEKIPEEERPVEVASPEPEEVVSAPSPEAMTTAPAVSEEVKPPETVSVVWDEVVVVEETGTRTSEDEAPQTAEVHKNSKLLHGKRAMVAVGILAVGIFLYLITLALTAIGFVGTAFSLGLGSVSSLMVVIGAAMAYPSFKRKELDEVFICPKCHESVDRDGDRCPACGAAFLPED
ncbi:MAG: hypothetical protein NT131_03925 [Methanomassiliicoccales archaeon]|nr:hypothetical protein [Methanomassiliicoccales archaeon]